MPAGQILSAAQKGEPVADALFDRLYPLEVQHISEIHFTPLDVTRRVLQLIRPREATRVLDVGSGVGKFCLAAALLGAGRYTGVEQNEHRHLLACDAAARLGLSRVELVHGDALALDWNAFDVLYFYNPFQALIVHTRTDGPVPEYVPELRMRHARPVRDKLRALPLGTRVVTFHGLGEPLPEEFDLLESELCAGGPIEVWIQRAPVQRGCG